MLFVGFMLIKSKFYIKLGNPPPPCTLHALTPPHDLKIVILNRSDVT